MSGGIDSDLFIWKENGDLVNYLQIKEKNLNFFEKYKNFYDFYYK